MEVLEQLVGWCGFFFFALKANARWPSSSSSRILLLFLARSVRPWLIIVATVVVVVIPYSSLATL